MYIENKNETPNHFLLITLNNFTIGLATYHHGIDVQVGLIEKTNAVIIGHEKELICCSENEPTIFWRFELDFCFYEFKIISETETIIVIDEISISSINFFGERVWYRPTSDIIERFDISSSEIKIKTVDSKNIVGCH